MVKCQDLTINDIFPDSSGHHHSRNQSQDHSSQSSYSFQDSTSSRYSSESSSVRSSGTFSPSDIHNWVGNYYKETFGGNKELSKPSDAEIENLFLDLMVRIYYNAYVIFLFFFLMILIIFLSINRIKEI